MNAPGPVGDTSIGGSRRDFPSTCWSRFSAEAQATPEARAASLASLARDYWKPIYTSIRSRFAAANEEAKDLTQDFFLWMMESDFVTRADPARGRFRAFVKASLRNYFLNEARKRDSRKRGGGREILAIGTAEVPDVPDAGGRPAEELLDEAWRLQVLSRAADGLEEAYRKEERPLYFALFQEAYLSDGDAPSYARLAELHGVPETSVANFLTHAKRRYREILRDLVAETVGSPGELREELESLFGQDWA